MRRSHINVYGKHFRTIWLKEDDPRVVQIIDQRHLPHQFVVENLAAVDEVARAIKDMHVRGAGLIGAASGFGMYIAALHAPADSFMESLAAAAEKLKATRPTAVNLAWAVDRQLAAISAAEGGIEARIETARNTARDIADEDAEFCRRIGEHGVAIIEEISKSKNGEPVNILTESTISSSLAVECILDTGGTHTILVGDRSRNDTGSYTLSLTKIG